MMQNKIASIQCFCIDQFVFIIFEEILIKILLLNSIIYFYYRKS